MHSVRWASFLVVSTLSFIVTVYSSPTPGFFSGLLGKTEEREEHANYAQRRVGEPQQQYRQESGRRGMDESPKPLWLSTKQYTSVEEPGYERRLGEEGDPDLLSAETPRHTQRHPFDVLYEPESQTGQGGGFEQYPQQPQEEVRPVDIPSYQEPQEKTPSLAKPARDLEEEYSPMEEPRHFDEHPVTETKIGDTEPVLSRVWDQPGYGQGGGEDIAQIRDEEKVRAPKFVQEAQHYEATLPQHVEPQYEQQPAVGYDRQVEGDRMGAELYRGAREQQPEQEEVYQESRDQPGARKHTVQENIPSEEAQERFFSPAGQPAVTGVVTAEAGTQSQQEETKHKLEEMQGELKRTKQELEEKQRELAATQEKVDGVVELCEKAQHNLSALQKECEEAGKIKKMLWVELELLSTQGNEKRQQMEREQARLDGLLKVLESARNAIQATDQWLTMRKEIAKEIEP